MRPCAWRRCSRLAAELRWILLGIGLLLLAGIWWWTTRRSGQAPGNPELREPAPPPLDPRYAESDDDEDMLPTPKPRDWSVSPFEPLSIRTAEFERVPVLDGPMMVGADPAPAVASRAPPPAPTADPAPPPAPAAAEMQKIITIRVCTLGDARWSGTQLMTALDSHGLAFGRYQVFHRKHTDGRSLFCVASLIEPGTFDLGEMAEQEFRGVTLFAVMPGPVPPLDALDEMFGTARGLAEELSGMVQDGKGAPLSPQRATALREDVAQFQALLPSGS
jgi:cell division protein ZipA